MYALRKTLGIILILLVPVAIALPGLPGDWMLLTGLCLVSERLYKIIKSFILKHKKLVAILSITWTVCFWTSMFFLKRLHS